MTKKADLFEDLAASIESWTNAASRAMTSEDDSRRWVEAEEPYKAICTALENERVDPSVVKAVLSECFRGLAVSFLTILDGGTALSEKGRLYLVDEKGKKIGEGLHDEFVKHLIASGRLE